MKSLVPILIISSAVLLILVILVQNQGAGLGTAYGGDSGFYRTKRGAEKVLFIATILLAAVFVVSLVAQLIIHS